MLKIGNVNIDVPVALAPMAGVTDLPFRLICKEFGCGMTVTELISAKAILYKNKNTNILLETDKKEYPAALQLFGSDPDIMADIAKACEERDFAMIDINMGCPVPKVVNNGEGSALLKDPKLVEQIVSKMAKAVKKPVTVKIRSGFSKECINAPEIARICEASGAKAVTVHARTREQYYSGEADWQVIADVKKAVKIPVIGNGDIKDGESAVRCIKETGCDGVMIGRASRGNPWIFSDVFYALKEAGFIEGNVPEPPKVLEVTPGMKKDMILRHMRELTDFKGEYTAAREMRKHFGWYTAGMNHATELRRKINDCESVKDLEDILKSSLV